MTVFINCYQAVESCLYGGNIYVQSKSFFQNARIS
jgi:hypothetical protein